MKKRCFKKFIKCTKGAISIFLSLMLTGVCSLSALVMEASRYKAAQQVLEEAAVTSALSSLAGADSTLSSRFGLYGVKTKGGEDSTTESYMKTNSDENLTDLSKLYNLKTTKASWTFDLANYSVLERQILEHEKYRAAIEIVERFADIDEVISNFIKQIEKIIPGVQEILKICDSICEIVEGIKGIYSLYKVIQQLEESTVSGAPGWNNTFSELATDVWEGVEKLFGSEGWDDTVADPSYYKAYNSLSDAIDKKVNYMKAHNPAPEAPTGERPTVNSTLKTYSDELYAVDFVLKNIIELEYFGDDGFEDGNCSDLYMIISEAKVKTLSSQLSYIKRNTKRSELLEKISEVLKKYKFSEVDETSKKNDVENLEKSVETKYKSYKSQYNSQASAQKKWDNENKAYNDYVTNIATYNKNIDNAKNNLVSALTKIGTLLNTYQTNYNKAVEGLTKATQAVSNIKVSSANLESIQYQNSHKNTDSDSNDKSDKNNNSDYWSGSDITKADLGAISDILDALKKKEIQSASEGIAFVANQKEALSSIKGENIDISFGKLSSHKNLGKGKMANYNDNDPRYYLTKSQMTEWLKMLEMINIGGALCNQLVTITESFKSLQQAFGVLPATYELDCIMDLSSATTSLFPSKTGTRSEAYAISSDIDEVRNYLNDARALLGSIYDEEINSVDPDYTSGIGVDSEELMTRIARISTNCSNLVQNSIDLNFIKAVFNIFDNIKTIVELIKDITYVATHIKTLFVELPSMFGESVLLNQFAVTKFSNRLDKVKGESGVGKGNKNSSLNASAQTFSQANLEYIVAGGTSEKQNQISCFMSIMALRMLNNAVLILTDEFWLEVLSACNVLSPLVFIILLYYESNIDMNLLIKLKMDIPLIKTSLVLSLNSLTETSVGIFEKTTEELTTIVTDDYVFQHYSKTEEYGYYYESSTSYSFSDEKVNEGLEAVGDALNSSGSDELSQYYASKQISENTKKVLKNLEKGYLNLEYRDYLFLFLLFQSNRVKVARMADLIQMELRYKEYSKGNIPTTLLEDYHTFIRVESTATLNSLLPIISLNKDENKNTSWPISTIKYVGY